jgi:hypothetical protein
MINYYCYKLKQARNLSLLHFHNNEKQFERGELTTRTIGLRIKKEIGLVLFTLIKIPI